jgi:hypothetical protein
MLVLVDFVDELVMAGLGAQLGRRDLAVGECEHLVMRRAAKVPADAAISLRDNSNFHGAYPFVCE